MCGTYFQSLTLEYLLADFSLLKKLTDCQISRIALIGE